MDAGHPQLFGPAALGPVRLRNRIIKAATFEGMSRGGVVSDALVDFHQVFAAGGVGLTTLAYGAVSPDRRGAPHEIVLGPAARPGLARLADALHAQGAAISAQIGHAGPVGQRRITGSRPLAASSGFSPLGTRYHVMAATDIARVTGDFAAAARVVAEPGFDAVELHMGHHYLLNSFLSPKFNRRTDGWGGSVANRARFPRAVAQAVRAAVAGRLAVTAKFEMADGVPGGLRSSRRLCPGRSGRPSGWPASACCATTRSRRRIGGQWRASFAPRSRPRQTGPASGCWARCSPPPGTRPGCGSRPSPPRAGRTGGCLWRCSA
jgi:2,4-dienoyl-CoA reductase-like NADH-dependent reductase (Old Yellow Enzyme family)